MWCRKIFNTTLLLSVTYPSVDLNELELPKTMKLKFPNPDDLLNFELSITPDEGCFSCLLPFLLLHDLGFYLGGVFHFTFAFKPSYPHEPPKVLCTHKVTLIGFLSRIHLILLDFSSQYRHGR